MERIPGVNVTLFTRKTTKPNPLAGKYVSQSHAHFDDPKDVKARQDKNHAYILKRSHMTDIKTVGSNQKVADILANNLRDFGAASQLKHDSFRHQTSTAFILANHAPLLQESGNYSRRHRRYSIDCNVAFTHDTDPETPPAWSAARDTPPAPLPNAPLFHGPPHFFEYAHRFRIVERMPSKTLPIPTTLHPARLGPYNPPANDQKAYDLEGSQITNADFLAIRRLAAAGWFTDDIINMSFDLLGNVLKCDKHRIALSYTLYARNCYEIGKHMADVKKSKGGTSKDENAGDFDWKYYKSSMRKFAERDFIILPINDGYVKETYGSSKDGVGTHWSVIVADCRGEVLRARYLDSLCRDPKRATANVKVARLAVQGLYKLLRRVGYPFIRLESDVEVETPHQKRHNRCHKDGGGACGPFVWAITKEISQFIVDCEDDGVQVPDLKLPQGFAEIWDWDSEDTRRVIQSLVVRGRRMRLHKNKGITDWIDLENLRKREVIGIVAESIVAGKMPLHAFNKEWYTEE
ncbi:hypothetical protein BU26DRAFT_604966 [Trematosphaeria pertusa]|uniref:Ubiquitin-like protease family profile domain-containing protein n=1 Tax=Trematosphaeria pertusa TaxID=390896 RepID=A0A6A6IHM8_9PLEO|nr:uncharacterized protein BU26DRAFT_604966 [Trematosphaeria pertusa]KAF2249043.1 hypothetical protein BU26DRAFT_604966 [Trematosphaeria pertusa]